MLLHHALLFGALSDSAADLFISTKVSAPVGDSRSSRALMSASLPLCASVVSQEAPS